MKNKKIEKELEFCPSCQQPASRSGNKLICETCGIVFTVTQKDISRVKKTGRFEKLEQTVKELKAILDPKSKADISNNENDVWPR